jgi:hypothetical protein
VSGAYFCTCLSISRDPLCVYHGDAQRSRADELAARLQLVRDALSLDLGDGVDVVTGALRCREDRDRSLAALRAVFDSDEIQVALAGNPNVIARVMAQVNAAIAKAEGR